MGVKCGSLFILACLLVLAAGSTININFSNLLGGANVPSGGNSSSTMCPAPQFVFQTTPQLFQDFSPSEFEGIRDFMNSRLNLVRFDAAKLTDSYIYAIEFFPPPKADALAFFNGAPFPGRFAKVIVYHGSQNPPVVREYKVGPVPVSAQTTYTVTDTIPYNKRIVCSVEYGLLYGDIMNNMAATLAPLFRASYGSWTYNSACKSNCFYPVDTAPRGYEINHRKTWFWFVAGDQEGGYLSPSGFEFQIDHSSLNSADWKVLQVWYNGQLFNSVQGLLDAFNAGTLRVKQVIFDGQWTSFNQRGTPDEGERKAPPRTFEPEGRRYTVNNNKVSYAGWTFEFQVSPFTGLNIWDARFLGQRMVYEAGVREASATYSGNSPVGARTSYLDTAWGIGASATQLKQGYDCPYSAYYTNITLYRSTETPRTVPHSLCIFEIETGFPIKRHYDPLPKGDRTWGFLGTTYGSALVIRTVTAVWNYDYFFEYLFYPTGHFEPRVSTTGYLQSGFFRPEESDFATRVHEFTQGQVHDHILNYKLDIDVVGTANSFEQIKLVPVVSNLPFFERPHTQKQAVKIFPTTEFGLKYNFSEPSLWHIVNRDAHNRWGVEKGVKLACNALVKNVIEESPLIGALSWSKYQLAVTQRKDSEPSSSSIYNQPIMTLPHVDFEKTFLDNENIVQKDLVVWVTLGVQHMPHAEDIPNTVTPGHVASIFVSPYNLFDEEPSVRMANNWIARSAPNGGVQIVGPPEPKGCQPQPDNVQFRPPV